MVLTLEICFENHAMGTEEKPDVELTAKDPTISNPIRFMDRTTGHRLRVV